MNTADVLLLLRKVLTAIILPPVGPLLFMLLGAWIGTRRPRLGQRLFLLGILTTVILAMPATAGVLQWWFEGEYPPISKLTARPDEAIVILGAGRSRGAVEYGGETVSARTLERLRYGAKLARESGLPVMVSGGSPGGGKHSEAELMAGVLKNDFGVNARWSEDKSNTTADNARFSIPILRADGIKRVALVTDVVNMPRAEYDFTAGGMPVSPAPMGFRMFRSFDYLGFVPTAQAYADSTYVLHELLGLVWARFEDHPYAT